MLVHIARGSTELRKLGIERGVFRDIEGKFSVDFEPLGTFTPLGDVDLRCHIVVIASPPEWARVIEYAHEAVFGFCDVAVNDTEVVDRNA